MIMIIGTYIHIYINILDLLNVRFIQSHKIQRQCMRLVITLYYQTILKKDVESLEFKEPFFIALCTWSRNVYKRGFCCVLPLRDMITQMKPILYILLYSSCLLMKLVFSFLQNLYSIPSCLKNIKKNLFDHIVRGNDEQSIIVFILIKKPNLFFYSSLCCWLSIYKVLIKNLTFFQINKWYLLFSFYEKFKSKQVFINLLSICWIAVLKLSLDF